MSRDKTREIKSPIDTKTREIRMEKTTEMSTVAPSQDVTARMKSPDALEAMIRLRMSAHDAHYGGSLVDGARMLSLFGDVATELLIRLDGDEGLFRAYDSVEFLAPVHAGDYIEARGKILSKSTTARRMSFEAWKVIGPRPDVSDSAADVLREPVLVCRASGTCVVPQAKQRGGG